MAAKRGRPPKEPDERKDSHVIVRVGQAERDEIERAAEVAGLRLSDWIRERLMSAAKRERRRASSP